MTTSQKISLKIERAWLLLPVSESAPDCRVSLSDASGHEVRLPFTAALSDEPQSWAPLPVGAWVGQTLELTATTTRDGQTLPELSALPWSQHDTPYAHQQLYREPLRPLIHFTAPYGWLNDPNGLTFFNGEYHLFYQHNPFGTRWGNMHWGHATSTDLFSWTDWGDVLEPDPLGPVFSGSAFVDETNEYGLGELPARPTLILVFTAAGNPCTQCLAWSQDGRTFKRYEKNPVILNLTPGNRDPKLFLQDLNGTAHLALYTRREDEPHTITFLSSTDLRSWDITGEVQGDNKAFLYECPDCFQLKTPAGKSYWVLLAANGEYAIGQFDGRTFHPEHTRLRTCRNDVMYAAQTFNHLPDDRRLLIGWLRVPAPGMPFSQCMSVPINLSLVETPQGPRLAYYPAPEITRLVKTGRHEQNPPQAIGRIFHAGDTITTIPYEPPALFALSLEVAPEGIFDVQFNGVSLVFNAPKNTVTANDKTYHWHLNNSLVELTIVIDRTVMEIFADDGLNYLAIPARIEPGTPVITVREGDIKCILTVSRSLQPARLSSKLA
ncbi:MAG: glycoside hydrolase family 32 protein [Oligosphaeraceae bacterium]